MSATTTAAAAASTIDLREPATYPLRLGSSLLSGKQNKTAKQYISLRGNHTPHTNFGRKTTATLLPSSSTSSAAQASPDRSQLIVQEEGQEVPWRYVGAPQRGGTEYILVVRPSTAGKEVVLERLGGSWEFSLVDAPEVDTKRNGEAGGQEEEEDDELFGCGDREEQDEASLREGNPFDYRHFLTGAGTSPPATTEDRKNKAPSRGATGKSASSIHNPSTAATASSNSLPPARPANKKQPETPLYVSPSFKKRKAAATVSQEKATPAVKRPKHNDSESRPPPRMSKDKPPSTTPKPPPPTKTKTAKKENSPPNPSRTPPQIRIPPPSVDDNEDDGELIVDNDPPPTSTRTAKKSGAMSLALSGQLLGPGPISLRSAASSPAARRDAEEDEEEEELEEAEEEEDEEEGGGDGDADVEDLALGSPAHGTLGTEVEEEDDLDAQLAAAMAEEGVGVEEESEESEEE